MKRKAVLVILVLVWCICLVVLCRRVKPRVEVDTNMYLLNEISTPMKYEVISDNTMTCNLATVSVILYKMRNDGFNLVKSDVSDKTIDLVVQKDDCSVRIMYGKDGSFASIASPYEKSYLPMTYINEEEDYDFK